jgi:hypothetical protein
VGIERWARIELFGNPPLTTRPYRAPCDPEQFGHRLPLISEDPVKELTKGEREQNTGDGTGIES